MSVDADLIEIVKEALTQKGVFSELKARVRAEVYHLLEDKTVEMPKKHVELFLSIELIREFLVSMKLDNSLSVFTEEIGRASEETGINREFLGSELGFNTFHSDNSVPLITMIVQKLVKDKDALDINSC